MERLLSKKFESVFTELLCNLTTLILRTLYKGPSMHHFKFNNNYTKKPLDKIRLKNKRTTSMKVTST